MKNNKMKYFAYFTVLLSIEIIFCFTPLGSLPAFGPIVATLSCIPVIITSLSLGIKAGTFMGFLFGLFSFIVWTFMPPLPISAFIFTPFSEAGAYKGNFGSIIICFIPRILIGITTFFAYKKSRSKVLASILGSLTNTIFVLLGIAIFFANEYTNINGRPLLYILTFTILTNGIPEALVSAIVCPPLVKVVNLYKEKLDF
ncbi:MAG: ECF transporter S component [Eubacteriales bacterium]|nr:ECF transporter S component [Eubacteriales bacterium]